MVAIDDPTEQHVTVDCDEMHGRDPSLKIWNKQYSVKSPADISPITTIKKSYPMVYVYCYRQKITIEHETASCPPYPFKLQSTQEFNTTDTKYVPPHHKYFKFIKLADLQFDVHSAHFESTSINDENSAYDHIEKLQEDLREKNKQLVAINVPLAGGITYSGITYFLTSAILLMLGFYILTSYIQIRLGKKNRKGINEIKENTGNYGKVYETISRIQPDPVPGPSGIELSNKKINSLIQSSSKEGDVREMNALAQ